MHNKFYSLLIAILLIATQTTFAQTKGDTTFSDSTFILPEYELITPTFLGNYQRNFYGNIAPDTLTVIWKHNLGKGKTSRAPERIGASATDNTLPVFITDARFAPRDII